MPLPFAMNKNRAIYSVGCICACLMGVYVPAVRAADIYYEVGKAGPASPTRSADSTKGAQDWILRPLIEKAMAGNMEAQTELAIALSVGRDKNDMTVTPNAHASWTWKWRAALQGSAEAQKLIGYEYESGNGFVSQDYFQAWVWMSIAANSGDGMARSNIADSRWIAMLPDYKRAEAAEKARKFVAVREKIEPLPNTTSPVPVVEKKPAFSADPSLVVAKTVTQTGEGTDNNHDHTLVSLAILTFGIFVGSFITKMAYKPAESSSGTLPSDSLPKSKGFLFYWGVSSFAVLFFLALLGYLSGGEHGLGVQLGRGLILAPIGGVFLGGIWKLLTRHSLVSK